MWQAPRGLGRTLKMNCSAVRGPHPSLYQSIAYKELFPDCRACLGFAVASMSCLVSLR